MVESDISKLNISRFPGSLEAVTWRKGTQDFGVTMAVPQEMREYIKPLMDILNHYFVIYCFEVRDSQQAELLLQARNEEGPCAIQDTGEGSGINKFCSLDYLASVLSMTPQNALFYVQKGIIIKVSRGRYDLMESVKNIVKELRAEKRSGGRRNEVLAEKEEIQKERLLVKLLSEKKKLVNAEDCVKEVEKNNYHIRKRLLHLPTKLAPFIAGNKRPSEIKEIIEDHVRECLTELAGIDPSRLGDSAGKQGVRAATKVKGKRVGGRKKDTKRNKR